jgi:hypothetical protein
MLIKVPVWADAIKKLDETLSGHNFICAEGQYKKLVTLFIQKLLENFHDHVAGFLKEAKSKKLIVWNYQSEAIKSVDKYHSLRVPKLTDKWKSKNFSFLLKWLYIGWAFKRKIESREDRKLLSKDFSVLVNESTNFPIEVNTVEYECVHPMNIDSIFASLWVENMYECWPFALPIVEIEQFINSKRVTKTGDSDTLIRYRPWFFFVKRYNKQIKLIRVERGVIPNGIISEYWFVYSFLERDSVIEQGSRLFLKDFDTNTI